MNLTIQTIIATASIISTALLALISYLGYKYGKKVKISSIYNSLTQQANIVNSGIGRYGIGGPYTTILNIPKHKHQEFGYYAITFFNHLNLLDMVHQNGIKQRLLKTEDVAKYKSWVQTVFKPWVTSNSCLGRLLEKVLAQEDIYGKEFLDWLRDMTK